jgi:hypothetical protein
MRTGAVLHDLEVAARRRGDRLLIDEAAMLDQDTARALLTVADETGARVAFIGDRRQLPAVGRGGVLDLAHRWVDPAATVSVDEVHRFTRVATSVDGAPCHGKGPDDLVFCAPKGGVLTRFGGDDPRCLLRPIRRRSRRGRGPYRRSLAGRARILSRTSCGLFAD